MIGIKRQCDNHSGEKVVINYLNVIMTRLNVVDKWLFATESRNRKLIMIEIFELKQKRPYGKQIVGTGVDKSLFWMTTSMVPIHSDPIDRVRLASTVMFLSRGHHIKHNRYVLVV